MQSIDLYRTSGIWTSIKRSRNFSLVTTGEKRTRHLLIQSGLRCKTFFISAIVPDLEATAFLNLFKSRWCLCKDRKVTDGMTGSYPRDVPRTWAPSAIIHDVDVDPWLLAVVSTPRVLLSETSGGDPLTV